MRERVEAAEVEETPPAPAAGRALGSVERVLALQRSAGNAAVTRLLQRQDVTSGKGMKWDPSLMPADSYVAEMRPFNFVFILGAKDDEALESATRYYRFHSDPIHTKVLTRADIEPTIAGIFSYLSGVKGPINEITLVIHGSGDGTLSAPLNTADTDQKTTPDELAEALDRGVLAPLSGGQITHKTRIRLQACFAGHKATMVNLLDRAFGEGAGTVIAPTVEVGYAKSIVPKEGITGWWVWSPDRLTAEELALALKTKYGASVGKLDTGPMTSDDELWLDMSKQAVDKPLEETDAEGRKLFLYVANAYVQGVKQGYEEDPALYTKSTYRYSPTEL